MLRLHLFIYLSVCVIGVAHARVCVWSSENNVQELVLSFYHVDPEIDWGPPDSVASTLTH